MGVHASLVPNPASLSYEDALTHDPANEAELALVARPAEQAADVSAVATHAADLPVMTIEELAEFLRVNHKTVREAIARGEIPGVRRIGGTIRILRAAVVEWLAVGQGRTATARRRR